MSHVVTCYEQSWRLDSPGRQASLGYKAGSGRHYRPFVLRDGRQQLKRPGQRGDRGPRVLLNFAESEQSGGDAFFGNESRRQIPRRPSMERLSIGNGHSLFGRPLMPRLFHSFNGVQKRSIHIEEEFTDFPLDSPFLVLLIQRDRPVTDFPAGPG